MLQPTNTERFIQYFNIDCPLLRILVQSRSPLLHLGFVVRFSHCSTRIDWSRTQASPLLLLSVGRSVQDAQLFRDENAVTVHVVVDWRCCTNDLGRSNTESWLRTATSLCQGRNKAVRCECLHAVNTVTDVLMHCELYVHAVKQIRCTNICWER